MNSPFGRLKNCDPPTYQDKLGDLIRVEKPKLVVETGFLLGFGSEHILKALDDNGAGHLYSIDPLDPKHHTNGCITDPSLYDANPLVHPRFTLIRQLSVVALGPLFYERGPFDMFIHDSDHSELCQKFEYQAAWAMVKPGGIIVSDDCFWGDPPHMSWTKFIEKHMVEATVMGNSQWVRRL